MRIIQQLISGRNNARILDHQDHRSLVCPGPVHDRFRHHKTLPRRELHGSSGEIDQQFTFNHIKELVVLFMRCRWYSPSTTPGRTTESFT